MWVEMFICLVLAHLVVDFVSDEAEIAVKYAALKAMGKLKAKPAKLKLALSTA